MNSSTNLEDITRPKSYITGEIKVKEDGSYRIINSYQNNMRDKKHTGDKEFNNEEEFKESIKIKINDELFDFHYYHKFKKGVTYKIEYKN